MDVKPLHSSRYSTRNILDDFREAYYWLRQNTHDRARVMSWWDYGYQIAGMANRTTLVDNNTWNNSHIAMVRAEKLPLPFVDITDNICEAKHFGWSQVRIPLKPNWHRPS